MRGTGRDGQQGAPRQGQFARPGHHRAPADTVGAATQQLVANLCVQAAGGIDTRPVARRQTGDPGIGARVQALGRTEQPGHNAGEFGRETRPGHELCRAQIGLAQPAQGQIQASGARVFADIPGDVGELHGHA